MKRLLTFLSLVLVTMSASFAQDGAIHDARRVVAISDVHGAYDAMVATLQNAAVIDEETAWVGGDTHLVIVGDLLDRGPRSRDAMDLMMRLEDEALAAGGQVHVLIGNHEMMNMIGDLRYVSKSEYAAFAKDETQRQRERWLNIWAARRGGVTTMLRQETTILPRLMTHRPTTHRLTTLPQMIRPRTTLDPYSNATVIDFGARACRLA